MLCRYEFWDNYRHKADYVNINIWGTFTYLTPEMVISMFFDILHTGFPFQHTYLAAAIEWNPGNKDWWTLKIWKFLKIFSNASQVTNELYISTEGIFIKMH